MGLNHPNINSLIYTAKKELSVALIDDSSLIRSLLNHILMDFLNTGYSITEFASLKSFIAALNNETFKIIIVDINIIENIKDFSELVYKYNPNIKIMAFTSVISKVTICATIKAGFDSFLLKNSSIDDITLGIKQFINQGSYLDPKISQVIIELLKESVSYNEMPNLEKNLTPREKEICEYAFKGLTNKQIAQQLVISKSTVDNHFINLYRKLGITKRTQLLTLQTNQELLKRI
ncbi:MAG: response regulator transcription factor [Dehalobacter sp. 4CP]|uniref:response regulator transcription factor n=1 Tax=Dehalobacter sp. CP TaxID=2594474 RepID=UPI0013CBAE34|nr:response regulator transcription factor [Dehalobacter sp. 4CP]